MILEAHPPALRVNRHAQPPLGRCLADSLAAQHAAGATCRSARHPVLPDSVLLMALTLRRAALHAGNCSSQHCRYFFACREQTGLASPSSVKCKRAAQAGTSGWLALKFGELASMVGSVVDKYWDTFSPSWPCPSKTAMTTLLLPPSPSCMTHESWTDVNSLKTHDQPTFQVKHANSTPLPPGCL